MKNTIDDADYMVIYADLSLTTQSVINSSHSHSIINKPFLAFIFNDLFYLQMIIPCSGIC